MAIATVQGGHDRFSILRVIKIEDVGSQLVQYLAGCWSQLSETCLRFSFIGGSKCVNAHLNISFEDLLRRCLDPKQKSLKYGSIWMSRANNEE